MTAGKRATAAFEQISLRQRVALVLGLGVTLFGAYGVIGQLQRDAAMRELPTWPDGLVAFEPAWVLAYGALYPVLFAPVVAISDRRVALRAAVAMATIAAVAMPFWLWLPVMRSRPELPIDDIFSHCLSVIYSLDPPNNCFPSMHVATTIFTGRCVWRHDRLVGALTLLLAGGVWYSSLAVAQHWFVDGLAGAAMALLADALAYRGLPRTAFRAGPRAAHLAWIGLWALLFVGVAAPYWLGARA